MSEGGDSERLMVLLEARITDFEKKMAQAERRGTKTYTGLRAGSRSATRAMETDMARSTGRINQALATTSARIGAVGLAFRGFLAGAVVGGLTVTVSRIGDVARGIAEVGNEAKRAGVSARAFQEWKYVAEQNRISVDSLVDGLKELNLRADEFVFTGKGPAAEAFQRLGYSAEDLKRKLADPSALLLEIIGRLGQMDRAAQIRISDEIFGGTAGERFVEILDQGEERIRSTIDEAHELGTVMDDLALLRPAPQQTAASFDETFSVENLADHDADVVLVIDYSGEDQDPGLEALTTSPLYANLAAAQADQIFLIDGTQTVGAAWARMGRFLDELESILLDPELDVDIVSE